MAQHALRLYFPSLPATGFLHALWPLTRGKKPKDQSRAETTSGTRRAQCADLLQGTIPSLAAEAAASHLPGAQMLRHPQRPVHLGSLEVLKRMDERASQVARVVKNLPAYVGDSGDTSSIPGSGRSPGGGNGNPLQYSCLENPVDRGAWWAAIHGVPKSWTQLKRLGAVCG